MYRNLTIFDLFARLNSKRNEVDVCFVKTAKSMTQRFIFTPIIMGTKNKLICVKIVIKLLKQIQIIHYSKA